MVHGDVLLASPSRGRLLFALVLASSLLVSCGGRAGLEVGSVSRGSGGEGTGSGGAGASSGGGGSDVIYTGVVAATLLQGGPTDTYDAFADFQSGPSLGVGVCPSGEIGCCCLLGIATPLPEQPPDAATLTLASGEGAGTLATLTPSASALQGTWDLGDAWATRPGDYPVVTSKPWSPGESLRVSATGGAVHAFSGTLETGALLSGVTPPIGPAPIDVDRTVPFEVSWAPEGKSNASVLLMLQQFRTEGVATCYCFVPDAASQMAMPASLLGNFTTDQLSANVRLERLVTTTASSDDATVELVGQVAQAAPLTFH
jgi:hypothetical protein